MKLKRETSFCQIMNDKELRNIASTYTTVDLNIVMLPRHYFRAFMS